MYLLRLGMRGMVSIYFYFNFEILINKKYDNPVKITPTKSGPKYILKIFSKTCPNPRLVSVRSSLVRWNLCFRVAPQVFNSWKESTGN